MGTQSGTGCGFSISVSPGIIGVFRSRQLSGQRPMIFQIGTKNQSRTGPRPRAESHSSCGPCSTSRCSSFAVCRPSFEVEMTRWSSNSPCVSSSPPAPRKSHGPRSLQSTEPSGSFFQEIGRVGKRPWSSSSQTPSSVGTARVSGCTGDPFRSAVPVDLPSRSKCRP